MTTYECVGYVNVAQEGEQTLTFWGEFFIFAGRGPRNVWNITDSQSFLGGFSKALALCIRCC